LSAAPKSAWIASLVPNRMMVVTLVGLFSGVYKVKRAFSVDQRQRETKREPG